MPSSYVQKVIRNVKKSNPHQPEFIQALCEVLESLEPLFEKDQKYQQNGILERIVEPERQIMFRVAWTDDRGRVQVNRGYRIQFNSAIGTLQGRLAFSSQRESEYSQVPRLRADFQEQPERTCHRRCEGRIGF